MKWVSFETPALVLLMMGGLNYGMVAIFGWDLVFALLGEMTFLIRIAYGFIGLAALFTLMRLFLAKQPRCLGCYRNPIS